MRTPQQAMKDAIDSGAVQAWIRGETIQANIYQHEEKWVDQTNITDPRFWAENVRWRPAPQKPTVADWRPIKEIPRDGKRYLVRSRSGFVDFIISYPTTQFATDSFGEQLYVSFAPIPE